MHIVRCKGQLEYSHGRFMCTTASLVMCIAALCGALEKNGLKHCMEAAMEIANILHGRVTMERKHDLMSVNDVLNSRALQAIRSRILFQEYIVMPHCDPELQGMCITAKEIAQRITDETAVILTNSGHSTCAFMSGGKYHIFDSLGAECALHSDVQGVSDAIQSIFKGQVDVTFISLKSEKKYFFF